MKSIYHSMNAHVSNGISNGRMGIKFLLAGMILFGYLPAKAQDPVPAPPVAAPAVDQGPSYNRFALGLKVSHLYDLKNSQFDLLPNGTQVEDMYGLHGNKTKVDMGAGLEATYFFSALFSMDLAYEMGKMTGANTTEYYESSVKFLSLGGNINLKRAIRSQDYKFVPYLRLSLAKADYDVSMRYVLDDGLSGKSSGSCVQMGMGLGLRYHLNNNWCLNAMSEFVTMNTDAWDGYNYGTGKYHIIKSSIGLKYSFGRGQHIDRSVAWQDKRVDRLQARLDDQVNTAIRNINDSVDMRFKAIQNQPGTRDSDDDGIVDKYDKCPNVAGLFSNNGCPPVEEMAREKEKETQVEQAVNTIVEKQIVIQQDDLASKENAPATKSDAKAAPAPKAAVSAPAKQPNTYNYSSNSSSSGLSTEEKYRLKNEILVEMNPIRFSINSYQLNAKAYEHLNTIAVILRNNEAYSISLKGFTDDDGSANYNKKLAEQRATAVSEYLQSRGISKERIKILAMGKDNPLDDNSSRIGKSNNRRVECNLE